MNYQPLWKKKRSVGDLFQEDKGKVLLIPLDQIRPNPTQPRKHFDEVEIVSLADSIRQHGLIQPITVRRSLVENDENDCFYCIAGERRLRAFKMLGKSSIPAILLNTSPSGSAELAIVENLMRKDLNLFEYAQALATLIEKYELTQDELARSMSTSQSNIANKLRLLRFTPLEQKIILDYGLTERHARAILRIQDEKEREKITLHIAQESLTVKETEQYIDKLLIPEKTIKAKRDAFTERDCCNKLEKTLLFIKKRGLSAETTKTESNEAIIYTISIPKSSV